MAKAIFYSVRQLSHFLLKMYWKLNGLTCQYGYDNDDSRNWGQDQDQHFDI